MSKFDLYTHIINNDGGYSNEQLQRIAVELIYAIYSNVPREDYNRVINEAIDSINDYEGLGLPYEEVAR